MQTADQPTPPPLDYGPSDWDGVWPPSQEVLDNWQSSLISRSDTDALFFGHVLETANARADGANGDCIDALLHVEALKAERDAALARADRAEAALQAIKHATSAPPDNTVKDYARVVSCVHETAHAALTLAVPEAP